MKWLITGGCGFIGTRLVSTLVNEAHHTIRIIDNLSVGTKEDLRNVCQFKEVGLDDIQQTEDRAGTFVEFIEGDILDQQKALDVTAGMDVIVHLAANTGVGPSVEDPRSDCTTNVLGTFNFLDAARQNHVKRFVFASSGAPIGECIPPIHEEMPPHPVSPYGASKLAGEGYCSAYHKTFGIETVALRFGNVYGPGSLHKSSVVAKFIQKAFRKETLEVYGDGGQTRDFIYIDDLIDAVIQAANVDGIGGQVFQIATQKESTVNEMTDLLSTLLNEMAAVDVQVKYGDFRQGDVKRNFSDISKAKNVLKWIPKHDLESGLRKTIQWFVNHNQN